MKSRIILLSRMPVQAYLTTRLSSVRSKLDAYPMAKLLSYGTELEYALETGSEDRFYLLRLNRRTVEIELHSEASPTYFLKEMLLKFLSVAAVLAEDYEIELRALFPYLIDVLGKDTTQYYLKGLNVGRDARDTDILLSKRIVELHAKNHELQRNEALAKAKLVKITASLITSRYQTGTTISGIASENGLSEDEVNEALDFACTLGYKKVQLSGKRFSLVKV